MTYPVEKGKEAFARAIAGAKTFKKAFGKRTVSVDEQGQYTACVSSKKEKKRKIREEKVKQIFDELPQLTMIRLLGEEGAGWPAGFYVKEGGSVEVYRSSDLEGIEREFDPNYKKISNILRYTEDLRVLSLTRLSKK